MPEIAILNGRFYTTVKTKVQCLFYKTNYMVMLLS